MTGFLNLKSGREMSLQAILDQHRLVEGKFFDKFTRREKDVAACIAMGMASKDIAAKLHISGGTLKVYACLLMKKLGVKNREELVAAWITAEVLMNPEKWAAAHSGPFAERFLR